MGEACQVIFCILYIFMFNEVKSEISKDETTSTYFCLSSKFMEFCVKYRSL
jgi:hypothetical protein